MSRPLRVLIVEQSQADAELLVRMLEQGGYDVTFERVETADSMKGALRRDRWDLAVSDYTLSRFSGCAALAILKEGGHDVPLIVFSSIAGEDAAVSAVKAGARDFLLKERPARLLPAIERQLRDAALERERVRAEEVLRQSESIHGSLVDRAVFGIYQATMDGLLLSANPALVSMLGYDSPVELLAMGMPNLFVDEAACVDLMRRVRERQQFTGEEMEWRHKTADPVRVRLSGRVIAVPGFGVPVLEVIVEDITERYQLEEQLRQAQKMEAVGRLAGGIAHDFNNLLTAILGYSELLIDRVSDQPDLVADLEEIRSAGQRARSLTRQLLAFSRKQVLQAQILDLNTVIDELGRMLRRVIGEDIDLKMKLSPLVRRVKADPGQVEQVLMNLAVNARDAMPRGGMLTIETAETVLPPGLARLEGHAEADAYISIAVTDTGCGMSPQVRARIFEPFFTTKGPDKGTGLGLSTVYGIVNQSGGQITVDSEPNRGTTFTVFLPAAAEVAESIVSAARVSPSIAGTETILLVDDEASLRSLARKVLERHGYTVLEASDGTSALTIADRHPGPIHLLLTDVIMPGLHGPDLAQWIVARRPDVRVLYMSGYPHLGTGFGSMSTHAAFLQKPFVPADLARAVRECLSISRAEADTTSAKLEAPSPGE